MARLEERGLPLEEQLELDGVRVRSSCCNERSACTCNALSQNGSMEEWKNGRWQDGSIDDGRMEWPFSASVLLAATVGCVVHAARVATCSLGPTLGTSLLVV